MARKKFQWSRGDEDDEEGEVHFTERGNRTEAARAKDRLFAMVKGIVELKPDKRALLPLSEDALAAVNEAVRIKSKGRVKGGLRRQLLYVARVLRQEDEENLDALFRAMERVSSSRER